MGVNRLAMRKCIWLLLSRVQPVVVRDGADVEMKQQTTSDLLAVTNIRKDGGDFWNYCQLRKG